MKGTYAERPKKPKRVVPAADEEAKRAKKRAKEQAKHSQQIGYHAGVPQHPGLVNTAVPETAAESNSVPHKLTGRD